MFFLCFAETKEHLFSADPEKTAERERAIERERVCVATDFIEEIRSWFTSSGNLSCIIETEPVDGIYTDFYKWRIL